MSPNGEPLSCKLAQHQTGDKDGSDLSTLPRTRLQQPIYEVGHRGTRMETCYAALATGRLLPCLPGTRSLDCRPGIYLDREANHHLAGGYSSFDTFWTTPDLLTSMSGSPL